MAPLPSNNTNCLFLDYNTCGEDHTILVRWDAPGSLALAMTDLDNFLNALSPLMRTAVVIGARSRAAGSTISVPIAWTGAAGWGSGASDHQNSAYYVDFVGRTLGGRRARAAVFGSGIPADSSGNDFRLTNADNANVAAANAVINATTATFLGIDGLKPAYYPYANIGTNAYWRNRIR